MAYSTDLRAKVIEYIEEGNSIRGAAKTFKLSRHAIYAWIKLKKENGSVKRTPYTHGATKLNDKELLEFVETHPDLYLKDYAAKFNVTASGIWRAFKRLNITFLKKSRSTTKETKS